jgi:hypothetical protein
LRQIIATVDIDRATRPFVESAAAPPKPREGPCSRLECGRCHDRSPEDVMRQGSMHAYRRPLPSSRGGFPDETLVPWGRTAGQSPPAHAGRRCPRAIANSAVPGNTTRGSSLR